MAQPSWAIVATVDEPVQLLVAFAAYHLGLGAVELHLYLDNPHPEAQAALAGMPGLRVTLCDEAHWGQVGRGKRPEIRTTRQSRNFEHAYRTTTADWLLHIDADEFVRDPGQIEQCIAAAADHVVFYQLGMLERVRRTGVPTTGIFDGMFRSWSPDARYWVDEVHGRFAKFMPEGFVGQWIGKPLVRTGIDDIRLGVHFPKKSSDGAFPEFRNMPRALYHFDGLTPMHTVLKLLGRYDLQGYGDKRKLDRLGRGAQMRYVRNNRKDRRALERLVNAIQSLTPEQEDELEARGLLDRTPFDPAPQLARIGVEPDLSVAAFDAALRLRAAEQIDQTAFADEAWGA